MNGPRVVRNKAWRLSLQAPRLQQATMASVATAQPRARLSRFEPDRFIDYSVLDSHIKRVRERYVTLHLN